MNKLFSIIDGIALWMHRVSGVLLTLMMGVVVVDVTTRTLFSVSDGTLDLAFPGGIELVSFGLLFCILFSLPHCVDKGQVVVDLFTQNLSATRQRLSTGFYTLGFAALGLAMSWRFLEAYAGARETLETSQDLLIPLSAIYLVVVVATAILGLRSLRTGLSDLWLLPEGAAAGNAGQTEQAEQSAGKGKAVPAATKPVLSAKTLVTEGETP